LLLVDLTLRARDRERGGALDEEREAPEVLLRNLDGDLGALDEEREAPEVLLRNLDGDLNLRRCERDAGALDGDLDSRRGERGSRCRTTWTALRDLDRALDLDRPSLDGSC